MRRREFIARLLAAAAVSALPLVPRRPDRLASSLGLWVRASGTRPPTMSARVIGGQSVRLGAPADGTWHVMSIRIPDVRTIVGLVDGVPTPLEWGRSDADVQFVVDHNDDLTVRFGGGIAGTDIVAGTDIDDLWLVAPAKGEGTWPPHTAT